MLFLMDQPPPAACLAVALGSPQASAWVIVANRPAPGRCAALGRPGPHRRAAGRPGASSKRLQLTPLDFV